MSSPPLRSAPSAVSDPHDAGAPELSIIIVSYNTRALLDACLRSVYEQTRGVSFEVIVVDNVSKDDSVAWVREHYPPVRLLPQTRNLGFGLANNVGAEASRAPWLLLLNSDTVLLEDTAAVLVEFLRAHPQAGAAGPRPVLRDDTAQDKTCGNLPAVRTILNQNLLLCRLFPRSRFFGGVYVERFPEETCELGWISGVCMALRHEAFAAVGGFDPAYFMYAEDIDLCRRLKARGWSSYRLQAHPLKHFCGGSTPTPEGRVRNHRIQQRNLLRLYRSSMSAPALWLVRVLLGLGLGVRVLARGLAAPFSSAQAQAFRAALYCLTDLVGLSREEKA